MVYSYLRTIYSELPRRSKKKFESNAKNRSTNLEQTFFLQKPQIKTLNFQSEKRKNSIDISKTKLENIVFNYKLLDAVVIVDRLDKKFLELLKKEN